MSFKILIKQATRMVSDSSPTILTALGVVGTATTAYLVGRASFKASETIRIEQDVIDSSPERVRTVITNREKVRLVWKEYLPAAGVVAGTMVCIVSANRISIRRAATMAAALSLSERGWNEYKEKVIQTIGDKKERKVRDDISQDRVNKHPVGKSEVVFTGNGEVLCMDSITNRYFRSTKHAIEKAEIEINQRILQHNMYASLAEFYDLLGLSRTALSENMGWSTDNLLQLEFTAVLSEEDEPCLVLNYVLEPIRNYNRLQ